MRNYFIAAISGAGFVFGLAYLDTSAAPAADTAPKDRYLCDVPAAACAGLSDGGLSSYVIDLSTYKGRNYIDGFAAVDFDGGCVVHVLQSQAQNRAVRDLDGGVFNVDSCFKHSRRLPVNAIYGRRLDYPDGGNE